MCVLLTLYIQHNAVMYNKVYLTWSIIVAYVTASGGPLHYVL